VKAVTIFLFWAAGNLFADSLLSLTAFIAENSIKRSTAAESWQNCRLTGLSSIGACAHIQWSSFQVNAKGFNTSVGMAYDLNFGLSQRQYGFYAGKMGPLWENEKLPDLTYIGTRIDVRYQPVLGRIDMQYGWGDVLVPTIPRSALAPDYPDVSFAYSLFSFTPQISIPVYKKLYFLLLPVIEKYNFENRAHFSLSMGLLFGQSFTGGFNAIKQLERSTFENTLIRKPNIYLYPSTPQQVQVTLFPEGEITACIPEYNDGWKVMAFPDGSIEGTEGYLFYEVKVNIAKGTTGWCLSQNEFAAEMPRILKKYGLSDREINDFMEYWQPELKHAPYYAVYPLTDDQVTPYCTLEINPRPEHIFRIWTLFSPLWQRIELPVPALPDWERKGFVAVEWGGAIID